MQIYSESAAGVAPLPLDAEDLTLFDQIDDAYNEDTHVFTAEPEPAAIENSLLGEIPTAKSDLEWAATGLLPSLPLTGLARKALQRLGVMSIPKVRIRA